MKKIKIIYCLTTRGLYSELFNLSLAIVYAHHHHLTLKVNTWLWNSRLNKGWTDYFKPTLPCCNNPFSAQDKVYTKEKPWIGKIYYKPREFFTFYHRYILNGIYGLTHPHDYLTKDVFEDMRSEQFIHHTLKENAFTEMAQSFKNMYKLNSATQEIINNKIAQLSLPNHYIGVHIRRGDKITSQEMEDIHLDKYINAIISHRDVSNNIYVATDDVSIIQYLRQKLTHQGINVYYNNLNQSTGFDESQFNHASKTLRHQETINVLLDMEVLVHSKFFIGTYTSNLSRVVPFFLGLAHCVSLDNDWNIINSLNNEVFNHHH